MLYFLPRNSVGRISSLMAQREYNQQERPGTQSKSEATRLAEDAIKMAMRSLDNSQPSTPLVNSRPNQSSQEKRGVESIKEEKEPKLAQESSSEYALLTTDMDDEFAELNMDELDEKVNETIKKESIAKALHDRDEALETSAPSQGPLPPPPFPKLHFLNLAHNQVRLDLV